MITVKQKTITPPCARHASTNGRAFVFVVSDPETAWHERPLGTIYPGQFKYACGCEAAALDFELVEMQDFAEDAPTKTAPTGAARNKKIRRKIKLRPRAFAQPKT